MLVMNIIFVVFFLPILPIMYFMLKNSAKPKKNMILYVTLPYTARQDEGVLAICAAFRRHLGIVCLVLAALLAIPFFIEYISIALTYHLTWLSVMIVVPFLSFAKYHRKLKRLKSERNWTTEGSGSGLYADSDEHWILGMFYCNPNDRHTMINARFGFGMTINLAKPVGKVLAAIAILCILAMPFFGAYFIPEEFTPARIEFTGAAVNAYHTSLVYEVPLDDIISVELLDALPRGSRVAGTAFDTLLKGRFRLDGIGNSRLCLNPKIPPFMLITTTDTIYIFGTSDAERTRGLYDSISSTGSEKTGAVYAKISAQHAKSMMDEGKSYILLDVRTDAEYKEIRIEGAILIPDTEIKDRAESELPDKDALILVYCRSGRRSASAANELVSMGYSNVYDFGGILDWPYETTGD